MVFIAFVRQCTNTSCRVLYRSLPLVFNFSTIFGATVCFLYTLYNIVHPSFSSAGGQSICRCTRSFRCRYFSLPHTHTNFLYAAIKLIIPKQPTIILRTEVERNTSVSHLYKPATIVRELILNLINHTFIKKHRKNGLGEKS